MGASELFGKKPYSAKVPLEVLLQDKEVQQGNGGVAFRREDCFQPLKYTPIPIRIPAMLASLCSGSVSFCSPSQGNYVGRLVRSLGSCFYPIHLLLHCIFWGKELILY